MQLPQWEVLPTVSTKYLGVIFDQHLDWRAQHVHALGKGATWTSQIKRLTRTTWGITPKYARKLYASVALPRTLYASDIWCIPTEQEELTSKGNAKVTKKFITMQRAGALAITGGLRTSPTDALDAFAFILPAPLTISKWQHRAMVRMAMLPANHPLSKPIHKKTARKIKKHQAPMNKLLMAYGHDPTKVEKIPAAARDPMLKGKLPFKTNIANDRETSIREAETAPEEVQVYSDGSALHGKVGAAAILFRQGSPPCTMHLYLGPEEEHTVHEAELVGILLALQLISTEKHRSTSFAIGVDNQAAIQAFDSGLRSPGHHLAREAIRVANQIQKRRSKAKYSLTIRWVVGHEGIPGNEAADIEAKKAARGLSSDKPSLPPYLRKNLLINPAAIKRSYHDMLKSKWKKDWISSTRGREAYRIDNTTPSKKFLGIIGQPELSREAASRIAQFKLTHTPVNQFLKRIGKVDSARCPACGEDEETIPHYLLHCPGYAFERWALARQAGKLQKNLTMEALLSTPELATPLANFIDATGRFKTRTP